jgi:hypothetical protein
MNKISSAPSRTVLTIALLAACLPSLAHHSSAMFDMDKVITLNGTVTEFQWTNPHCFIQLAVPRGTATEQWSVEMGAPIQLFERGWKRGSVKPGDKISVVIHPMRDGSKGGAIVSAATADGTPIGKKT